MNINVETIVKDNVVLQLLITVIVAIVLHILLRALVSAIVDRMVRQRNYSTKGDEIKRRDTLKGVLRTLTTVVLWVIVVLVLLRQSGNWCRFFWCYFWIWCQGRDSRFCIWSVYYRRRSI